MSTQAPTTERQARHRATQLLRSLGWQQISADQARSWRQGSDNEVLLHGILERQLHYLNTFERKGLQLRLGKDAIREAIRSLARSDQEQVVYSNEKIWSLLKFGTQVRELVEDDVRTLTVRFIDWEQPRNNAYHFIEDLRVAGPSGARTVDVVLFVNGIPFVVIAEKAATSKDSSREQIEAAITQLLEYQSTANIAQLFRYTQLLLAVSARDAVYAPVGAERHHWARWRESYGSTEILARPARSDAERPQLPAQLEDRISAAPPHANEQDRLVGALCLPERLLEMTRWFTFFISGQRYLARHHQYFAVHAVLARVQKPEIDGRRPGGVVMHTQGSGKTLTMVMLSQVLLDVLRERSPRVLLVTDRSEADENLYSMLLSTNIECRRATTGRELRNLLQDRRTRAITTVIHKFSAALNAPTLIADSADIFVLIDEAHRTQAGQLHYAMRRMLPRACFIGFTGAPLDARAHDIFGEYLSTYKWEDAIQDDFVVPMQWELRDKVVERDPEEQWWPSSVADDSIPLDYEHYVSPTDLFGTESRVQAVAADVARHFNQHFAGTGLKGQLVASSRRAALLFKKHLDEIGTVTSEVAISLEGPRFDTIQQEFRNRILATYGSEAKYQADLVRRFEETDDPKILIAVDKLTTGLNVPRCSVIYITRPLRGPALLQTIARANRRHENKTQGLIVDYVGLAREIRSALTFDLALKPAETPLEGHQSARASERPHELAAASSLVTSGAILSALKQACQRILQEELDKNDLSVATVKIQTLAQRISEAIFIRRKVDWTEDLDLQNQVKTTIEDELFEMQSNEGIILEFSRVDSILDRCMAAARQICA